MKYLIQIFYILTVFIGVSAFSIQLMARAKNLTANNRLVKGRATTLFLALVVTFNFCDFLILFLTGRLGETAVNWILVAENVLEVALAYALVEMEREYFQLNESRVEFIFFTVTAGVILWIDAAYTAGMMFMTEQLYFLLMMALNLLPVLAIIFFTGLNLRKILNAGRSLLPDRYFLLYNAVFFFLCLVVTLSVLDARTQTDYMIFDRETRVLFWFVFNVMNFVLIWCSCQSVADSSGQKASEGKETPDEKILRVGKSFNLSERELEIALLLCRGKNNNDIAGELFLSPNTVKVHTSNLYKKLGVKNRVQAVQVLYGDEMKDVQ